MRFLPRLGRIAPLVYIGIPVASFKLSFVVIQAYDHAQHSKPAATTANTQSLKETVYTKPPVRLTIDTVHVDAEVKPVGLTNDGNMAIDSDPASVAWYMGGPKPGEVGSAVIAGHYGWKNGVGSVFNDIHALQVGDKVTIADRQGGTMTFLTQRVQTYDMSADTTDIFTSHDGKAHLNLITCEGVWNDALKTYSQRLVVFADKEERS